MMELTRKCNLKYGKNLISSYLSSTHIGKPEIAKALGISYPYLIEMINHNPNALTRASIRCACKLITNNWYTKYHKSLHQYRKCRGKVVGLSSKIKRLKTHRKDCYNSVNSISKSIIDSSNDGKSKKELRHSIRVINAKKSALKHKYNNLFNSNSDLEHLIYDKYKPSINSLKCNYKALKKQISYLLVNKLPHQLVKTEDGSVLDPKESTLNYYVSHSQLTKNQLLSFIKHTDSFNKYSYSYTFIDPYVGDVLYSLGLWNSKEDWQPTAEYYDGMNDRGDK